MATNKERVFVTGATGKIGSGVVRGLVKKGVKTTAYVRDEQKTKELFKEELKTGHLSIVIGTYSTVDVYTKAIQGHTRLFLLFTGGTKPTAMSEAKGTLGRIAYKQGVRQIVDLSSITSGKDMRNGMVTYMHMTAEEKLWTLAEENSEQRSLVVLRPMSLMSNHLRADVHYVKKSNKIVACGPPSATATWIDPKDISDIATAILTEPVEKHDRMVYEIGAQALTNEERAAVFSKVLGRPIKYEQQSMDDYYKQIIQFGMPHGIAFNLVSFYLHNTSKETTPELSLVIGRPLRTLEDWIKENIQAFQ